MSSPVGEATVVDLVPKELFVDGEWRTAAGGATFAVEDPATQVTLCDVADAAPEDGLAALSGCARAQAAWASTSPQLRSDILRRTFDAMSANADALSLLMTLEMGKPLAQSRAEVMYAAEFLRWFSEQAVRVGGRTAMAPDGDSRLLTVKAPVGPCVLITPWNFPLAMGTRKIGPALAAGCTVIVKPAAQTPLSMLALGRLLSESGLPSGVLHILPTSRAGAVVSPLLADPRTRKVSFTGSTSVGRHLIEQSAQQVLRVSMELGGNAPFLVFADADLDAAVDGALLAKMRNNGEACTAANRFHVQRAIADEFTERLARRIAALPVGRGTETGIEVGPLIDDRQRDSVSQLVDDARARGADIVTGGDALEGAGYFFAPTVLADVPADAAVLREEIFGPVAPVSVFDDEDEAYSAANATPYGLVAYVYTRDLGTAMTAIDRIETGMLAVNRGVVSNPAAPFGGVKHSGYGREGGYEGIDEYLETKYVSLHLR